MSVFYFAYGSNMNPVRLQALGLAFVRRMAGCIPGLGLRFNKRASDRPRCAYANAVHAPGECLQGVLYALAEGSCLAGLDAFEGAPRLYSRDVWWITCAQGRVPAWMYVANPALIEAGLLPEAWYMQHLLAGRDCLSDAYVAALQAQPVLPVMRPAW